MRIEFHPMSAVKPYPENPRADDAAITVVACLIRDFGIRNPILLDAEGVVISGHTRLAAMLELDMTEVPVIVCDWMPPERVRALRHAGGHATTLAAWLEELLFQELVRIMTD